MVVERMEALAKICGYKFFRTDEPLFLEIYTIYLFHKKHPFSLPAIGKRALTQRQGRQIGRLYRQYILKERSHDN